MDNVDANPIAKPGWGEAVNHPTQCTEESGGGDSVDAGPATFGG